MWLVTVYVHIYAVYVFPALQLIYVHMIVQQLIKVRLASMHVEKLRLVHLTGHEKQDNEDGV